VHLCVEVCSSILHTVGLGDAIQNLRHLYTFCVGCPWQTSPSVQTSLAANVSKHVIDGIFRVKYNIFINVGLEVVIFIMIGVSIKIKIYRNIILPVILYGFETWSLILR
jgi:hypothetical protein